MSKLVFLTPLLAVWSLIAGPAYPLRLSEGNHYLVDQNNRPFFIQGDAGWYVIQRLNATETDFYLSNRCAQGFNSILLDLQSHQFGSGAESNPSADVYGHDPFTNTISGLYTNLLAVNPDYYTNADFVIQRAGYYGLNVFLFPLYAGYNGGAQGWYADMVGNGSNNVFQFGQFVGNRYKNASNLVWVLGGDYAMPDKSLADALAAGIWSQDTNHLFTAHAGRNVSGLDFYSSSWDGLNSTYTGTITYQKAWADYQRQPVAPTFLIEANYEVTVSALACRQEAWGAVLSGCAGHIFGNDSLWSYSPGWQALLSSPGATTVCNVIKLMNSRPWYNCIPDANHTAVTSGYGTWGDTDYVSVMREATGKTVIAYIPQDMMAPTVDLTKVSGPSANAWWYNPQTGEATAIGTFSTAGTQQFTPPNASDWVLVLDDAAQNYGPPGGKPPPSASTLTIQRYAGQVDSATGLFNTSFSFSFTGSPSRSYTIQYTANLNDPWQSLTNITANAQGVITFQDVSSSVSRFYRIVSAQ